jgi:hypothetical protein
MESESDSGLKHPVVQVFKVIGILITAIGVLATVFGVILNIMQISIDFKIRIASLHSNVKPSQQYKTSINVGNEHDYPFLRYDQDVFLGYAVKPKESGIQVSFAPQQLKTGDVAMMKILVGSNVPGGDYEVKVIARGADGTTHNTVFNLTIPEKQAINYLGDEAQRVVHAVDCVIVSDSENDFVKFTLLDDALNQGYKRCEKCIPAIMVYVTKSGSHYHRKGCASLTSSQTAISLEEAQSSGYAPCSKCNPP